MFPAILCASHVQQGSARPRREGELHWKAQCAMRIHCTPIVKSRAMTCKLHCNALHGQAARVSACPPACQCACLLAYLPRNMLSCLPARIDACLHACLPVALPSHHWSACLVICLPPYRVPTCPPAWHPQIATVNASAAQQWISAIQAVIDKVCRWCVPDLTPSYHV